MVMFFIFSPSLCTLYYPGPGLECWQKIETDLQSSRPLPIERPSFGLRVNSEPMVYLSGEGE
jgi:hypothetical protein